MQGTLRVPDLSTTLLALPLSQIGTAAIAARGMLPLAWPPGGSAMLRSCSRVIALTAMVACLSMTASADESLTLACQGMVTVTTSMPNKPTTYEPPEPISMGIILNLTDRTVSGLGSPVTIDSIEDVNIQFSRSDEKIGYRVSGSINRVTGDTEITKMDVSKALGTRSDYYLLQCRPTQRMF